MKVDRYYLEINSLNNLIAIDLPDQNLIIEKVNPPDIEINKFFYKSIDKNHRWVDRLVWDNLKWMSYLKSENVHTYILKVRQTMQQFFHQKKNLLSKAKIFMNLIQLVETQIFGEVI